jgi:hypothetical protein
MQPAPLKRSTKGRSLASLQMVAGMVQGLRCSERSLIIFLLPRVTHAREILLLPRVTQAREILLLPPVTQARESHAKLITRDGGTNESPVWFG